MLASGIRAPRDEPQPLLDLALHNDWLSGHFPRDGFAAALNWLGRPIEYFSAVREPVSQILAHLNWQFEIYHRGPEYFCAHGHEMQLLSAEVRATDFSKPSSIIALLLRYVHVFLDCQARYILGGDFASISDSEVARRVATYSHITTTQNLSALYPAFGFAALPGGRRNCGRTQPKSTISIPHSFRARKSWNFSPITTITICACILAFRRPSVPGRTLSLPACFPDRHGRKL
jgi:hypothetical protein